MRVQRLIIPGTGDVSFTVVGSDGLPIGPIESFLSLLSSLGRSPNTVRAYAHDLKQFFEFLDEAAVEWNDVELDDVVNFVAWLRNPNSDNIVAFRPIPARQASTINRALVTVERLYDYQGRAGRSLALGGALRDGGKRVAKHGFLSHAARDGRRNSFLRLPQPRRRPKTLEPEQVRALLAACTNLRDLLLLALLYDTGLRVGAALGLRHRDVEPRRGVVRIIDRPDNSNGAGTKGSSGEVCASQEWFRLYHRYCHVAQQSSSEGGFAIRLGTELEPPAGDLQGDHPYVERLQRRGPRQQRRFLGL
jgi:integrase/recombinase XerD